MLKDIVVCINESEGRDATIAAAAQLAKEHDAVLHGLYVRIADTPSVPPYGLVSDEIIKEATRREDERAANSQQAFETTTHDIGCETNWLELSESQHPMKVIAYADIVITNQVAYDPREGRSNMSFINSLILETGKPVVLIPLRWRETSFGNNILIGWDESREAIRAVQDAMPFLQRAKRVEAVAVNYEGEDESADVSEIQTFLQRRDVNCGFKLSITDEHLDTPEKVILNRALKQSSDLIVVGGYGHTRLREIILGGVTRYLCKHSDVPVLLSH